MSWSCRLGLPPDQGECSQPQRILPFHLPARLLLVPITTDWPDPCASQPEEPATRSSPLRNSHSRKTSAYSQYPARDRHKHRSPMPSHDRAPLAKPAGSPTRPEIDRTLAFYQRPRSSLQAAPSRTPHATSTAFSHRPFVVPSRTDPREISPDQSNLLQDHYSRLLDTTSRSLRHL